MQTLKAGRGKAVVDGGEIAYLIQGEGLPLATAHPYTTPKEGFGEFPGIATITVWPRGFGGSSDVRDRQDFGMWRLADDLDGVRQHLGLDRWAFWGTSMGGFTALVYALKFQPSLVGLILDSTAASYRYREDPESIWPKIRQTPESAAYFRAPSWDTLGKFFTQTFAAQGAPDPAAAWQRRLAEWDWNPGALAEILRRIQEFDTEPRLGEIHVPCLVLSGGTDLQCPPGQGRRLAAAIPGAVLEFFPKTGHGVLAPGRPGADAEEHRRVVDVATAFVKRAYSDRPAVRT
jgi:pimeloyl-ACP methyl ester carboxylesterase